MTHIKLLEEAKRVIRSLESDTSVPPSQTKGELLDLIDDMQVSVDAIEEDTNG